MNKIKIPLFILGTFFLGQTCLGALVKDRFNSKAFELSAAKIAAVKELKNQISHWAFRYNGQMAQNPEGNQDDILERAGLLCMIGISKHCEEVALAQGQDGRFWRAQRYVDSGTENSFSRDHLNGVFAYLIGTKDQNVANNFEKYLKSHQWRLCEKASDNRCRIFFNNYGMMREVWKYIGLKPSRKMHFASIVDDPSYPLEAMFSRSGFESVLPVFTVLLRRAMNKVTPHIILSARLAHKKQPLNALVKFADEGISVGLADLLLEACPSTPGPGPHDFIWNRELRRNEQGSIVVVRDWGEEQAPRTHAISDGWDCLLVSEFFLYEARKLGLTQ